MMKMITSEISKHLKIFLKFKMIKSLDLKKINEPYNDLQMLKKAMNSERRI